jgi:hypothetical protein
VRRRKGGGVQIDVPAGLAERAPEWVDLLASQLRSQDAS